MIHEIKKDNYFKKFIFISLLLGENTLHTFIVHKIQRDTKIRRHLGRYTTLYFVKHTDVLQMRSELNITTIRLRGKAFGNRISETRNCLIFSFRI